MVLVGFSTKRVWNPFSAVVRAILGARISHSWLLVEDPALGSPVVLEARWPGGYQIVPYRRFRTYERVIAVARCAHPLEAGVHASVRRVGAAFDLLGIVGIGLFRLAQRVLGARWRNPFAAGEGLYCSRAVLEAMQAAGYPGAARMNTTLTTPTDLLAFLEGDPGTVVRGRRLRAPLTGEVLRRARRLRLGRAPAGERVATLPLAAPHAVEVWEDGAPRMAAGE